MKPATENRREYFRHQFGASLCAQIRIVSINGKVVDSKKTYVCVRDIGAGGLKFESHLNIPASDSILIEASMMMCDKELSLYGTLIRSIRLDNGYFEYGMKFAMTEDEKETMLKITNEVAVKSRKTIKPIGCSMCSSYTKCHKNMVAKELNEKYSRQ